VTEQAKYENLVAEVVAKGKGELVRDAGRMMVMPANQTNELVHLWAGMYSGVGHLYTPARKERVRPWLPYALDNGRFAEAVNGLPFDESGWLAHVERYVSLEQRPLWLVVPDVPFDGPATLEWWDRWEPKCRSFGVPLAIAVQNRITIADVRPRLQAGDVVFVGGDTEWKWATAEAWCKDWPHVHVGRVNSPKRLYDLHRWGCASCDGSGWFRGKSPQVEGLARFLAWQSGEDEHFAVKCGLATRFHSTLHEQGVLRLEAWA
jgi:hypothetical protein